MKHQGMTPIVKNTARLIAGFITVFAIYVALTGHLTPGGGFAGGVILAAAAALIVLAFGRRAASKLITETKCHLADAAGAAAFLAIAMLGFVIGGFFDNFIVRGTPGHLVSGGTIPLSNFAILIKVGAGLAGGFLALAGFALLHRPTHEPDETEPADPGPEA
jgi:multisubunit Na+/H+ antiporter MnhB subunit